MNNFLQSEYLAWKKLETSKNRSLKQDLRKR